METKIAMALDMLKKSKVDFGEVFGLSLKNTEVRKPKKETEEIKSRKGRGLAIRVFSGDKMGFSYTSDLSRAQIEQTIRRAIESSRYVSADNVYLSLKMPEKLTALPSVKCYDPRAESVPLDRQIELTRDFRDLIHGMDIRVKESLIWCTNSVKQVFLANTEGLNCSYKRSYSDAVIYYLMVKEDDQTSSFCGDIFGLYLFDLNLKEFAREAVEKAILHLHPKEFLTSRTNVVLDQMVTAQLLGAIIPAFYADKIRKGKSLFKDMVGQKVASEKVTLIDDGTLEGGAMTAPIDNEGTISQRTVLIEEGRLEGYLYDLYNAEKMRTESTGNCKKPSLFSPPGISATNFYLKPSDITREEILSQVKEGIYISDVLGAHTIDPVSGDFSLGAKGIVIKDGELVYPVSKIGIAGNVRDLLNSVEEAGNDLRLFSDGSGGQTVLLKGISVSGK